MRSRRSRKCPAADCSRPCSTFDAPADRASSPSPTAIESLEATPRRGVRVRRGSTDHAARVRCPPAAGLHLDARCPSPLGGNGSFRPPPHPYPSPRPRQFTRAASAICLARRQRASAVGLAPPRSGWLRGAEDAEAFAFGGGGLAAVEGDEFQGGGLVLGGDEGGADVEGVRGAK